MRVVDAEALIDAIQARIQVARDAGDGRAEDALDDAIGLVHKLLQPPGAPDTTSDQLAAAGAIIAALVRQLDSYGAIVPHLPNVSPGQQSAATRMLAGAGLDCNGRRVA